MAKITTNRGGSKKAASKSLPAAISTLEEVISSKQSPVDIKKFAYIFMERIGGPVGFVDKVMEEYNGSDVGSLARARALEIMMKLFQLATPKETFGDYSDLTDDDLKMMLSSQFNAAQPQPQWIEHVCI